MHVKVRRSREGARYQLQQSAAVQRSVSLPVFPAPQGAWFKSQTSWFTEKVSPCLSKIRILFKNMVKIPFSHLTELGRTIINTQSGFKFN